MLKKFWLIAMTASFCLSWSSPGQGKDREPSPYARHPVILVPGWGPDLLTSFDTFIDFLIEDGVPPERIHLVPYDYFGRLEKIERQLTSQISKVMAAYDPDEQFIFVTHSTGQFVSLQAIFANDWDSRVARHIGLGGIARGWNFWPSRIGLLGRSQTKLSPYLSPYLTKFWQQYDERTAGFDTCAVFSPDDGLVFPYDSGRMTYGRNVSLPGVKHLNFIKDRDVYEAVKESCF